MWGVLCGHSRKKCEEDRSVYQEPAKEDQAEGRMTMITR